MQDPRSEASSAGVRRDQFTLLDTLTAYLVGERSPPLAEGSFDMVYAVDSFSYLHEPSGALLETHFAESARVLIPGGDMLILNFSYHNDPEQDSRDIKRLATTHGVKVLVDGAQPFRLWDGRVWHLRLA